MTVTRSAALRSLRRMGWSLLRMVRWFLEGEQKPTPLPSANKGLTFSDFSGKWHEGHDSPPIRS